MKSHPKNSLLLIGLGLLVPMVAARGARMIAGHGYKLITNREVPKNPANPEVEWREALIWAAVSGVVGGMARLSARRLLAETFIPAEGDGLEEDVKHLG